MFRKVERLLAILINSKNMTRFLIILFVIIINPGSSPGQTRSLRSGTKIMTLGVFHFNYPNLDVVRVEEKDQISVLDEPFQSEIKSICDAIAEFHPTIIAIESTPDKQHIIDSLYMQYKGDNFELTKNEIFQLGFRIGRKVNSEKIFCVDDYGRHYENLEAIFTDSVRLSRFEDYYMNYRDTIHENTARGGKISNITDALYECNQPESIKERLATYLLHPFKYEENEGDFTGVDFETGRWFNRNLRIFRNIQRIPVTGDERILLIIGSEHLNLLNIFFETSWEFELVSPLPYLEKSGSKQ